MARGIVRVGIIGAGKVVRAKHLPGLLADPAAKVVGVCNLRRDSAIRVAREFGIPKVFDDWEQMIGDPGIDAVVIGTWPYMHCPITLGALDAGKHVLCQGRMAMNAREAQRMLDFSRECPGRVAMVAPSPLGLVGDAFMIKLLADGYLGLLREIHARSFGDELTSPLTPMTWRQMTKYVGFNMLNLGELYETLLRWTPQAIRVYARATKQVAVRPDPETGKKGRVGTADSLQALTAHEDGSAGTFRLSAVTRHDLGSEIALYGSEGTLIYNLTRDEIRGARAGEPALRPLAIPPELRGGWTVEADFLAAITEGRPVTRTDFATAALTMHFAEAVARSSRHQEAVDIPLTEFSNPTL